MVEQIISLLSAGADFVDRDVITYLIELYGLTLRRVTSGTCMVGRGGGGQHASPLGSQEWKATQTSTLHQYLTMMIEDD